MTDLQIAKRTINTLADALWSAQTWETAEQIRQRVMRNLTVEQVEAIEKQISTNREKQAALAAESTDDDDGLTEPTEASGDVHH